MQIVMSVSRTKVQLDNGVEEEAANSEVVVVVMVVEEEVVVAVEMLSAVMFR